MTKIIIIDDETHCTNALKRLIENVEGDHRIIGIFNDPEKGLDFIKNNRPDILFLDIEMPNLNGFSLLDQLMPVDFDVIFTTAYDRYAIKAFRYSAINYLLKPINENNILMALSQRDFKQRTNHQKQWDLFKSNLQTTQNFSQIALPTAGGFEIMEIKNLIRCQSDSNYTNIFCNSNHNVLISRTLKEIEELLTDHGFIRVHQSHLINPKFVKGIVKQDGGSLVMTDDAVIPVSRQKSKQINEILQTMVRFK